MTSTGLFTKEGAVLIMPHILHHKERRTDEKRHLKGLYHNSESPAQICSNERDLSAAPARRNEKNGEKEKAERQTSRVHLKKG